MILVDTNLLLRYVQQAHEMHPAAVNAINKFQVEGVSLYIVPQVVYEFWVVATRPSKQNGLGWSASEVSKDITSLRKNFRLLRDERTVFDHWYKLITTHAVLGKPAHDARLVAAMHRHRIPKILTFNVADFTRYPNIEVLDAAQIGAESS